MIKVPLYIKIGGKITPVGINAIMPPFNIPPDVLVWGIRHFIFTEGKYIEGFAYSVVESEES